LGRDTSPGFFQGGRGPRRRREEEKSRPHSYCVPWRRREETCQNVSFWEKGECPGKKGEQGKEKKRKSYLAT